MRNLLVFCYLLLCLPFGTLWADEPQLMKIFSREVLSPLQFELSDSDWRWLGMKRELSIAVYAPENPPFDFVPESGTFEGISADYSQLVAHYLGLGTRVLRYPNRAAALEGLSKGEADMLVDDAGGQEIENLSFISSIPFTPDHPVLVARETAISQILLTKPDLRIALLENFLSDEWLAAHYPHAQITRYDTPQTALSSVAFGENDYFIGNLTVTSFLIERNYANILSVADVFPAKETGPRFLFRADETILQQAVDTVLKAIPQVQHKIIFRQWSQGSDLWQFQSHLALTVQEQRWLEQHSQLRVVIDPLYAPFTMFDDDEQFHGIAADVLRLVHFRTGLNFKAVEVDTVANMFNMVSQNKADLIAAMSPSATRDKQFLFTRPYILPPFVLVVQNKSSAPKGLSDSMRLAITPDSPLQGWLKERYPNIQQIEAGNDSMAMQLVNEGKADGAVNNLIGASYMIDHYFHGKLRIASRISEASSRLAFAVGRDEPELYSILNKALADIPPRDISMIANRWQGTPDVKLDTWVVYSTQFYWLAGIFTLLVLTSLVWNYYLRREIRMRQDAQAKLQEQATFRETLFNGTPIPVYVVVPNGNIIDHNQAWDVFFKHKGENPGQLALNSPSHPLAPVYPNLCQMLTASGRLQLSPQRYSVNNGEEERVILHQAVSFTDLKGKVAGVICSWQDITEHEHLMHEFSTAWERAEQANRTKSTFLATMSHEIRTPISAIIGLLELAVTSKTRADRDTESVQIAYESALSLMGLIGDILDIAKIESGKLELLPEWVPFNELVAPVVRVFEGLARQKNLAMYCHIDVLHPDEICIDPMRLRQILSNLISNAIKFTEQGSVDVQLTCLPDNDQQIMLELVVTDTGIGIAEEDQKLVFSPYEQSSAGKKQTGTGLGLAICTQLVAMMGGAIDLHSQLGRGTRITLRIPVDHRQYVLAPVASIGEDTDSMRPLQILAVDDHPANRLLLKRQLTRLGHNVIEAENGEQALQLWQVNDIDLVITDCSMPVMDGLALTRLLRQAQTNPLTIMGLTANAQPEERVRCLAAGMDDCLFKPLRLPQLEALLRKVPRHSKPRRGAKVTLGEMVDLNALRELAQNDTKLLYGLLRATRDENLRDMQQTVALLAQQAWSDLARCLHRLAGAAQIIGAEKAEKPCRELEKYCEDEPEASEVETRLKQALLAVTEFNQAIEAFIAAE
ncbi:transporter substrate-binding domain-containing protein [Serratia fonticola]|uniref:transporter substrate-binding domain-containing protein n=1 Tax=Serratia fonticola TaxID=47917 RepID=UPI001377B8C0|nr:transporter substrate-binding domain-containing protein [Serratia fonticola]NBJ36919.1 transporter substrate-binding domain-containing protein [Serratia fonticola]